MDGAIHGYTKTFAKKPSWKQLPEADKTAYRTRKLYIMMKEQVPGIVTEKVEAKEEEYVTKAAQVDVRNLAETSNFQGKQKAAQRWR